MIPIMNPNTLSYKLGEYILRAEKYFSKYGKTIAPKDLTIYVSPETYQNLVDEDASVYFYGHFHGYPIFVDTKGTKLLGEPYGI